MVLIGEDGDTKFSYLEYQALMLFLAGGMCLGLVAVEWGMQRFQVLPVLCPGMFSIRERLFYFFDFEIRDGALAHKLRGEAKTLVRMTLCVVISYLWQHCVLETTQQVGTDFPQKQCEDRSDCFASDFHVLTLLNRQHEPVDCLGPQDPFPGKVVVSCIRFVRPSASVWLMHMAIAHSLTQLNLKSYEVFVWIAGNSRSFRLLLGALGLASAAVFFGLFFGGVVSEFYLSWLSFVTSLSIPIFFYTVWKSSGTLEELWTARAQEVQSSIQEHLDSASLALPELPRENSFNNEDSEPSASEPFQRHRRHMPSVVVSRQKKMLRMPVLSRRLTKLASGAHNLKNFVSKSSTPPASPELEACEAERPPTDDPAVTMI